MKLIERPPNVVVVDIQLKTGNGLDLIARIKACDKSIRILVWSMYPDALYADAPCAWGPWGTSTRNIPPGEIVEAIRRVRDGKITFAKKPPSSYWARRSAGAND